MLRNRLPLLPVLLCTASGARERSRHPAPPSPPTARPCTSRAPPTCSTRSRARRVRAAAVARRESPARRALLVRRRARPAIRRRKPSFDATNPASYSWGEYDALIAEAQRLHWKVLLTVTSPVPRWATSNRPSPYVTRPDDLDFQQFMTAVGRHFGSSLALLDLERAQPSRLPAAAVQLPTASPPRRASTAASTRPATRGCRPRDRASEGADGRDRAVRLRHGERAQGRLEGAAARRRAARLPARRALPERPLQEIGLLRPVAGDRLSPTTPTRCRPAPTTSRPAARRRHDRRALAPDQCA